MNNPKKVIIVGAGFGGLAAAAFLAKAGLKVTIIEKNEQTGGRARVYKKNGFVFDLGPSWYLMPEVFEKFFAYFGKKPSDYYQLSRLNPNYRIFWGSNDYFDVPAEQEKILDLFETIEQGAREKLREYLRVSKYQYDVAMQQFMYREYRSVFDFFNLNIIINGLKLRIFQNIDSFIGRYFKSARIKKILEYTMVFLGSSPYQTPALYSIMSHVDFNLGVWYPQGGIGQIVLAMEKLVNELGVEIVFNQKVDKVEVIRGQARAVLTDRHRYEADIVLVNADYHQAETNWLDNQWVTYPQNYWEKKKMGPSAFLIYLGLNKKIDILKHHNLYLDHSWENHFRTIFAQPNWPDEFSYYISCPSKSDPSVAPQGKENLFVLVPVAAGLEDNQSIRDKYFDRVIRHIEKTIGQEIRSAIEVSRTFAHNDFIADYQAYKGTALGLSHTLFQTAIFRPSFKSKKVRNLYYAGSYTHPGIGVPMVIIAAQVVSERIIKENAK